MTEETAAGDGQGKEDRGLLQFVPLREMEPLVSDFASALGCPTGIVRLPDKATRQRMEDACRGCMDGRAGASRPEVNELDALAEAYRVVKIKPRCSPFCEYVRKSPLASLSCMCSDLKESDRAHRGGEAVVYRCHLGLVDIVAAIRVGGFHVANVHCGQIYGEIENADLARVYKVLGVQKACGAGMTFKKFLAAREKLLRVSDRKIEEKRRLLTHLASLISEQATAKATVHVLGALVKDIEPVCKLREGLLSFMEHARRIVQADSGSVWMLDPDAENMLKPEAIMWGSGGAADETMYGDRIPLGEGLAGKAFKADADEGVVCETQADVERTPAYLKGSRAARELRSFIGMPIRVGDATVGVFEMGAREEYALRKRDAPLVKTLAGLAGVFVRSTLLTETVLAIASARGFAELATIVVQRIPRLVNARGASLFLRRKAGTGNAYLVATSSLNVELVATEVFSAEDDLRGKAFYEPGEGLTGWVLKTGRCLNLQLKPSEGEDRVAALAHFNESLEGVRRKENLSKENLPDVTWLGKYWTQDGQRQKDYYAKKPTLAVPLIVEGEGVIGVLSVPERIEGNFDADDRAIMEFCAKQIVRVLTEKRLPMDIVTALITAIDAKDPYTKHHSQNVRRLAVSIGREMRLSEEKLRELELAALMHDIGKIGVPDFILSKPGELNQAEHEAIESHAKAGYNVLAGLTLPGMESIRDAVHQHHERGDGKGYPRGMKSGDISLLAKIIAVADSYDAIVARRPYKDRVDPQEAVRIIIAEAKPKSKEEPEPRLDPDVVQAFKRVVAPIVHVS